MASRGDRPHSGGTIKTSLAILLALAAGLATPAAFPGEASARGLCLILLGCRPEAPVVKPPPPVADPCPPQTRRGGGSFVGIVSEDVFWGATRYRSCNLNDQGAIGVDVVRQTVDWAQIERRRNQFNFSWFDGLMAELARRRIGVLPILFNAPRFRSFPRPGRRGAQVPRRAEDMGRFAARVVRRYGPRGSFWRSRPDLPRTPIRSWQIWNEPNVRVFWPPGPSPQAYTRLLQVTARHIRREDRGAEIVTAGIPDSRHGIPLARFVSGMYRAGAGPAFDTLAVNAYAGTATGVPAIVRRARRLMDRHGDRRGALRVTEFGWATGGPRSPYRVTPDEQARRLTWTLRTLYVKRRALRLRGVVYYNWRDGEPYPPLFQDFFGLHTGLLDRAHQPKPAYHAFREIAPRLH